MRTVQALALPESATIKRATQSSDGAGGVSESFATVATVAARLAPGSGRESAVAGKISAVGVFTITVPAGTDVTADDRIVIGSRTFHVVTTVAGTPGLTWQTAQRVIATEIV